MRYAFMHAHADRFSLTRMSRVLSVSRSGYHAWCRRGTSTHASEDRVLTAPFDVSTLQRTKPTVHGRSERPSSRKVSTVAAIALRGCDARTASRPVAPPLPGHPLRPSQPDHGTGSAASAIPGRPPEPVLGRGRDLHPYPARLALPRRADRRVFAQSGWLGAVRPQRRAAGFRSPTHGDHASAACCRPDPPH